MIDTKAVRAPEPVAWISKADLERLIRDEYRECNLTQWITNDSVPLYLAPPPAIDPGQPVAWRHILTREDGTRATKFTPNETEEPFGVPGEDFSEDYLIASEPLYLAPPTAIDQEPDMNDDWPKFENEARAWIAAHPATIAKMERVDTKAVRALADRLNPYEEPADVLRQCADEIDALKEDAERLEFLMRHISGKALRPIIGEMAWTGDLQEFRSAIDHARKGTT
jgi:hypothetical protein